MIANNLILALALFLCLVASIADAVCPNDFSLLMVKDGSTGQAANRRNLRRQLQAMATPPIQILQTDGEIVEFAVQNTTSYGGSTNDQYSYTPDNIFVAYETDNFGSQHCHCLEDLGPVNLGGSASESQTAHCRQRSNSAVASAVVRLYVRGSGTGGAAAASFPSCCTDPYPEVSFDTVEYIYELKCQVSCTESPSSSPTEELTDSPTNFPTQMPSFFPTL